ncbi:MAG: BspA family leucine-rich repeat surface protein [Bacteroides sp.]
MRRFVIILAVVLLTTQGLLGTSYGQNKPFITRWSGKANQELKIPIFGSNYKLVIKKASDNTVLKTEEALTITESNYFYKYIPSSDEELLVEAGPEGVEYIRFVFNVTKRGSAKNLLAVEQFGKVAWTSMEKAFAYCENMQFASTIDTPDLSAVTDMSYAFNGCKTFNQPLNNWDVSNVEDMSSLFSGCSAFNQTVNDWEVDKVIYMGYLFDDCKSFNQPLNNWNVKNANDMSSMFSGCNAFNQILNRWKVSNVVNMRNMFSNCKTFNQDIGMWELKNCSELGLKNCGMNVENYSKSLESWAAQANIMTALKLDATGLQYNKACETARTKLINNKSWEITGDTQAPYLEFKLSKVTVVEGKKLTLVLIKTGIPANETIALNTDNESTVQIVDKTNLTIKGLKAGKATITATIAANEKHEKLTATCEVTVKAAPTIKFNEPEVTITQGQQQTLVLNKTEIKEGETVTLTSSADEIVKIIDHNSLKIEAVTTGKATITATIAANEEHEKLTTTCEVTVKDIPLSGLKITPSETRLKIGQITTLKVSYEPVTVTQKAVRWSTNNATIVSVDENGNIKGIAKGQAIITVTSKADESITATCHVTVDSATATDDSVFANIVVAPTPFDSQIRIINNKLRGVYALFNAQGVVIISGALENAETTINTTTLPTGMYFLHLASRNGVNKVVKVVKQ